MDKAGKNGKTILRPMTKILEDQIVSIKSVLDVDGWENAMPADDLAQYYSPNSCVTWRKKKDRENRSTGNW